MPDLKLQLAVISLLLGEPDRQYGLRELQLLLRESDTLRIQLALQWLESNGLVEARGGQVVASQAATHFDRLQSS